MRIGIISHSFTAAFRIYEEIKKLPGCELYLLLTPPKQRSPAFSILANFVRMFIASVTSPGWQLSRLPINRKVVFMPTSLDDPDSIAQLKDMKLDVGLLNAGIIYREPTINAFRLGILNPHIGLLPAYRGRSVMEWSLLQGDSTGISVFFIDAGIDTGSRIVFSEEVSVKQYKSVAEAKQHLFNLDATFFRKALELIQQNENEFETNDLSGKRYYVMSQLFTRVVNEMLAGNN
jgi:methionyl-tRNA formyltransferase